MGLDLKFTDTLVKLECAEGDLGKFCEREDHECLYNIMESINRGKGLPEPIVMARNLNHILLYGCFDTRYFRRAPIGAYALYGEFRNQLARLVHDVEAIESLWDDPDQYAESTFAGILFFGDNEGCIGPEWSQRLATDFANWRYRVVEHSAKTGPWFLSTYTKLYAAFETAAQGGCVKFC
jgi:hypothetical protein